MKRTTEKKKQNMLITVTGLAVSVLRCETMLLCLKIAYPQIPWFINVYHLFSLVILFFLIYTSFSDTPIFVIP